MHIESEVCPVKNCGWYLWLGGNKIFNIRQLRDNFDTALLTGYFLGGSLMKWLSDIGEYSIMKRLSEIDIYGDIGKQLEFAFGVSPDKKPDPQPAAPAIPACLPETPKVSGIPGSFAGIAGSFTGLAESSFSGISASSFAGEVLGSFAGLAESSFTAAYSNSFAFIVGNAFAAKFTSSYNFGVYSSFVSGQALNIASSAFSGSAGSFGAFMTESLYNAVYGGSFTLGSFSLGSYTFGKYGQFTLGSSGGSFYGSFGLMLLNILNRGGSFGSYGSFGNVWSFFGEGSFRYSETGAVITAEEYHRTLINLSSCPLNAYGYGINLV